MKRLTAASYKSLLHKKMRGNEIEYFKITTQ